MYQVGSIEHKEMVGMVKGRLNRLAMCKRGVLETEKRERELALGNQPSYTPEEREVIQAGLNALILKAMTPTASMVKKFKGDVDDISRHLKEKAKKSMEGAFMHPGVAVWKEQKAKLQAEFAAREATLDGDFRDLEDEFTLGLKEIKDLPAILLDLEAQSW